MAVSKGAVMIRLNYGRTNTFLIQGTTGNLLVDTDYAGTFYLFYKALRENSIGLQDVIWILATHYHLDHLELMQ